AKTRPKSCFVTSSQFSYAQCGGSEREESTCVTANTSSSIAKRLALLKQNGEEGWKNRIQKSNVEKEIIQASSDAEVVVQLRPKKPGDGGTPGAGARGSVIANRLSCLQMSQNEWRSRVNESDAKQFTVASRQNRQSVLITDAELS